MSFQAFVDFYTDVDDEESEYVDEHLRMIGVDYTEFRKRVLGMIEKMKAEAAKEELEKVDDHRDEDR